MTRLARKPRTCLSRWHNLVQTVRPTRPTNANTRTVKGVSCGKMDMLQKAVGVVRQIALAAFLHAPLFSNTKRQAVGKTPQDPVSNTYNLLHDDNDSTCDGRMFFRFYSIADYGVRDVRRAKDGTTSTAALSPFEMLRLPRSGQN